MPAGSAGLLARQFALAARGTTVTTELRAGVATFMVMAYIAAIKILNGKARELHRMVYAAAVAFVVYFALPLIERAIR